MVKKSNTQKKAVKPSTSDIINQNLIISAKNFGPISVAENIEIKPLTIFIGQSNSGKTILATLIYSCFKAVQSALRQMVFEQAIISHSNKKPQSTKNLNESVANNITVGLFAEIERCHGVNGLNELVKDHSIRPNTQCVYRNDGIGLKVIQKIRTKKHRTQILWNDQHIANIREISTNVTPFTPDKKVKRTPEVESLKKHVEKIISSNFHFFPAAKSGLMKTHNLIFDSLLNRPLQNGEVDIPSLDGVTADFLRACLQITSPKKPPSHVLIGLFRKNRKKNPLKKYVNNFESRLLGGKIVFDENTKDRTQYQIQYKTKNDITPVRRASSMIGELSILSLFLKHYIEVGDTIIIEEPESHLHPEAQQTFANLLVRLVNDGVSVIATTHSPIIIEEISNCVLASAVKNKNSSNVITASKVAIYGFEKDEKRNGTKVKEINFDKEIGAYPTEEYDAVFDEQINTATDILSKRGDKR